MRYQQPNVDVEDALNRLGIDGRSGGENIAARCPFHEDSSPSLSIHSGEGVWQCHGCHKKGNLEQLWAAIKGIPVAEARGEMTAIYGVGKSPARLPSREDVAKWESGLDDIAAFGYLESHAIPIEFAREQGVGFDGESIVWPVRDRKGDGLLIAKRRRVLGLNGEKPKAHSPRGRGVQMFPLWLWKKGQPTVICEGEADALALHAIGVNALTTTGGVKTLTPELFVEYVGHEAIVCLDADDEGRRAAKKLTAGLAAGGVDVHMVDLGSGDIGDALSKLPKDNRRSWWNARVDQSTTGLEVLAEQRKPTSDPDVVRGNDLFAAEWFIRMHGERIRWVYEERAWTVWTGKNWQPDREGIVAAMGRETIEDIFRAAESATADGKEKRATALSTLGFRLGVAKSWNGMMAFAQRHQLEDGSPVSVSASRFASAVPMQLPVLNGVVDLLSGELDPHDPENWNRSVVPIKWDADAKCPVWEKTIREIFAHPDGSPDEKTVAYFQRVIGYCLTSCVDEDAMFVWHGTGANGKSLILGILARLLGDYSHAMDFRSLLDDRSSTVDYHKAMLAGVRCAIASELPGDGARPLDEGLIKSLTGRDKVTARKPREMPITFHPTHKIIMACNSRPTIRGGDRGIWRRIHYLPFEHSWDPEHGGKKPDRNLEAKLVEELPGILVWAVRGSIAWAERRKQGLDGLDPTDRCKQATRDYQIEMDGSSGFVTEWCEQRFGARVMTKQLYLAYEIYCRRDGIDPLGKAQFTRLLRSKGCETKPIHGNRYTQGVQLTEDAMQALSASQRMDWRDKD